MDSWSSEDRAAARAFLQRCEVRLSTLHRVATALLSGAGLMVLLPAILRDQLLEVLRTLLTSHLSAGHIALASAGSLVLAVPLALLIVFLADLTRFYFHAQHLRGGGVDTFAPRFTLTGLRLPANELSTAAARQLTEARLAPEIVELLVPSTVTARARIDAKLAAYGADAHPGCTTDAARAAGLFQLVAAQERTLGDEVAKMEHGLARHLLRLQVIVMRYVKALLAFVVTAPVVFVAAAIVRNDPALDETSRVWLAVVFATWAPAIVLATSAPVRWIAGLLREEHARVEDLGADPEFTRVERIAIVASILTWAVSTGSVLNVLSAQRVSQPGNAAALVALAATAVALGTATMQSIAVRGLRKHRRPA